MNKMKEGQRLKSITNKYGITFYFCPDCDCLLFSVFGNEKIYQCLKCNIRVELGFEK
jgi:hypothetical protein